MKVLWVTNTIFPAMANQLGISVPVVGGWMYSLAEELVIRGIELTVVTVRHRMEAREAQVDGINYFILNGNKPITEYDHTLEGQWNHVIEQVQPELIHIHGTEYAHGLALLQNHGELKYVISIQGIINASANYYNGQIADAEIRKNITFRDVVKRDNLFQAQRRFQLRGERVERRYFELASHFIGRTSWDRDHSLNLNPNRNYYSCNENLRDKFYSAPKWNLSACRRHSIFISQANYPLKGFHQLLKALPYLIAEFPDIEVRIAGANMLGGQSWRQKLAISGYGKYLNNQIRDLGLQNHVKFIGLLDKDQMIEEYLKAHAFVCPSSIENSPNSLGEAQILGTPCIASYVGGVPDMVTDGKSGLLYRFEEIVMLAAHLRKLFKNDDLAMYLSSNSIEIASKRHDRNINTNRTIEIYREIAEHEESVG